MAFYSDYDGHTDDFYSTPSQCSEYNMVPTPFQATFSPSSWYEFNEPKVSENHSSVNEYYSGYVNPSEINYPVYHCTELKLLQHDPSLSSETKSTISYPISTEEFDDEFENYSPNPYRGGSIPSPYGKDDLDNLSTKTIEETDRETDDLGNGGKVKGTGAHGEIGEPVPNDNSDKKHDDGRFENGRSGDYDDKIGWQTSYGSGLESLDLCESIFGYWPCLDKIERQRSDDFREICDQESRRDPWKLAADYLFGSPSIYENENYLHLQ